MIFFFFLICFFMFYNILFCNEMLKMHFLLHFFRVFLAYIANSLYLCIVKKKEILTIKKKQLWQN